MHKSSKWEGKNIQYETSLTAPFICLSDNVEKEDETRRVFLQFQPLQLS